MSMRRNLLLSYLATQFKWLPYSYEYIYHNLVPSELPRFNIWDEEWELGSINDTTGVKEASTIQIRSKNFIKVNPNETYYMLIPNGTGRVYYYASNNESSYISTIIAINTTFTTPSNCQYIRFRGGAGYGTTYNHDICINKSNAQLNGHYAPYSPRKVLDKSRILKISGNSEVRNQLLNPISWNYTFTTTLNNYYIQIENVFDTYQCVSGHTYLFFANCKRTMTGNNQVQFKLFANNSACSLNFANGEANGLKAILFTATSNLSSARLCLNNYEGKQKFDTDDYFELSGVQFRDLSQAYPFNTPTSITDPRVQNIIAQGYLPKNDGEIKNSVISEIESGGFNIWDEEWEVGSIDLTTGQNTSYGSYFRSKNFIKVLSNQEYYFKGNNDALIYILKYDENYNYLGYFNFVANRTILVGDAKYIRFINTQTNTYNHDICINRSSSLNGIYKPHIPNDKIQLPAPLELGGVNTAENTFEVTDEAYVFTRNVFDYVFSGNESWESYGSGAWKTTITLNAVTLSSDVKPNLLSNTTLETKPRIDVYSAESGISINNNELFVSSYANLTGKKITYQLATPQVISIPRKHLGVIDLSNATIIQSNSHWRINITNFKKPETNGTIANIYCSKYLTVSQNNIYQNLVNGSIASKDIDLSAGIEIYDTNIMQASDLAGLYIFYETQNETTDFVNEEVVESGGEVNAPTCEVLPNVEMLLKCK